MQTATRKSSKWKDIGEVSLEKKLNYCQAGKTKGNIKNNSLESKEKNTKQINTKTENEHLSERTNSKILLKLKENIPLTHQKDLETPSAKSTWGNSDLPSCSAEPCVGLCQEGLWCHLWVPPGSKQPSATCPPSWQHAERAPHSGASDSGR